MVTIKEIAAKAHLSTAAVSRALRNDETLSITPETRAHIWAVATELGYTRPAKASAPSSAAERSITIVHKQQTFRNQIDSSYYFAVRSGIEDMCAKARVRLSVAPIEDLSPKTLVADGIVLVGNYTQAQFDALLPLAKRRPVAVVGIVAYRRDRVDQISYDNRDSVSLALSHLLEKGHRRIGYLGVKEASGTELFGSRKDAFTEIIRRYGEFHPEWILESDHGSDRVERGYSMAKALAALSELPTAIFCANDPIALGAINGFAECGLKVPDDISIVAHDGSYPTQHSMPPLTTVDVHPFQLGVEAARLVLQHLDNEIPSIPRRILLYPTLIERMSVLDIRA
jgi:LacI family transcriptional regulator